MKIIGRDSFALGSHDKRTPKSPKSSWQLSGHNAVSPSDFTSVYDFNLLLAAQVATNQWSLAVDMFNRRQRSHRSLDIVSLNTCLGMMRCRWVFALVFLTNALLQRMQMDERTVGSLMASCRQGRGLWKKAEALFWNMFFGTSSTSSLRANVICQSSLMTSHLSQRQWCSALAVWTRSGEFGLKQDQTSKNIALNAWCHRWVQAGALLRDIDSTGFNILACSGAWHQSESLLWKARQIRIHVDSIGCAAILSGQTREWRKTFILFRELFQLIQKNIVAYTALTQPQTWMQSITLLHKARHSELEIDQVFSNSLVCTLAHGRNPWQTGLDVLRLQPVSARLSFGPEMSASLLHRLSWAGAIDVINSLRARRSVDSVALNAAIDACDASWNLCISLLAFITALNLRSDQVGYAASIASTSVLGEWTIGLALLHSGKRQRIQLNEVMVSAAQAACGKGMMWMLPVQLLNTLTSGCTSLLNDLNEVMYAATISSCSKCSEWTAALQGMLQMDIARMDRGQIYLGAEKGGRMTWRAMLHAMDMSNSSDQHDDIARERSEVRTMFAMSSSWAMLHMWEQSLRLLQAKSGDSVPFTSRFTIFTGFTSFVIACEHVKNTVLLAKLFGIVSQTPLKELKQYNLAGYCCLMQIFYYAIQQLFIVVVSRCLWSGDYLIDLF